MTPNPLRWFTDQTETPLGTTVVIVDEQGRLRALGWERPDHRLPVRRHGAGSVLLERAQDPGGAISALRAYWAGDFAALAALPTATDGTPFQQAVWAALRDIPPGQTITYGQLAERIGRPAAVRAVGLANGANPTAIAVPCHRVIGANAALTGYGGGVERKRALLVHEGALAGDPTLLF